MGDHRDDSDAFSPHLTRQFGEENICLVGGLEPWNFMTFQKQLGMSSSQHFPTPSFFRGIGQPPTRDDCISQNIGDVSARMFTATCQRK